MENPESIKAREMAPGKSDPHESAALHVSGEATYVDDIPELAGTRHVALGLSQRAHARIKSISLDAVKSSPGVVAVLSVADIPASPFCRTSAEVRCLNSVKEFRFSILAISNSPL